MNARTAPNVDEMTNSWGLRLIPEPHKYGAGFTILVDTMANQAKGFQLLHLTASGSVANEMAIREATDCQPDRCLFAMGSYVVGVGNMLELSTAVNIGKNNIGIICLPNDASRKAREQTVAFPYHIPCATGVGDREIRKLEKRCLEALEKRLLYAKLFSDAPYKAIMMEYVLSGNGGELTDRFLSDLGVLLKRHCVAVIVDEILNGGRVGPKFCVTMTTPKAFKDCVRYITFGKFMHCGMLLCHKTVFPDRARGTTTTIDSKEAYDYVSAVILRIENGDIERRREEVLGKLFKSKPLITEENYWGRGLQLYTSYLRRTNDDNLKHRLLPMLVPGMKIKTTTMDKPTWTRTQLSRELMDAADLWLSHLDERHSEDLQDLICKYILQERLRLKENLIFPDCVLDFVAQNSEAETVAENYRKRKRQQTMGSCTLKLKGCIKKALKDATAKSSPALTWKRVRSARVECFQYNLPSV